VFTVTSSASLACRRWSGSGSPAIAGLVDLVDEVAAAQLEFEQSESPEFFRES